MKQDSILVKAGRKFQNAYGSMNSPVYHSSTILFPSVNDYNNARSGCSIYSVLSDDIARDYSYSSVGTPTSHYLAQAIAEIEEGGNVLIYPSGLFALSLVTKTFAVKGSHILVPGSAYFRYKRFVNDELVKLGGVEVTFYNSVQGVEGLIKENTALIMIESPSSITFEITDVKEVVKLAKEKGIVTMCDNSCATPLLFKPLNYGVDIVVYSLTKYFNGHSDLLMGAAITRNKSLFEKIYSNYRNHGVNVSPDDCYLVHRGMRTLHIRMERYQSTAMKLASWLERQPSVKSVLYPALPSHPHHNLWKEYFNGAGGLFSIILDKKYSNEEIGNMINNMKIFGIGASWGGCDSLVLPVDIDPDCALSKKAEYQGSCIRVFCGLEDSQDLIDDFRLALERLTVKSDCELVSH